MKIKKTIKSILYILLCWSVMILVFVGCWRGLRYLVTDDTKSYTRITMHEFYDSNKPDILFMGASHCYRGFAPQVIAQKTGQSVFNLASSSQRLDTTYLLLREAVRRNKPKQVFLEVSFALAQEDIYICLIISSFLSWPII